MLTSRLWPASRLNSRMLTMMKTTRNSVPQRGCAVGYWRTCSIVERVVVLERVDGHVLGAVVLEDAPDLRRPADEQQVADEDGDPDEALDQVLR